MEKAEFRKALNAGLTPPQAVVEAIRTLPRDAPNFSIIVAGLAAYVAASPASVPTVAGRPHMYRGDMEFIDQSVIRTLSTIAVVVTLTYCHRRSRAFVSADPDNSYVENVLIMMGFVEKETSRPASEVVETLNRLWVLYLDHEMTNSTAALLHIASTLADPLSCCIGFVASANGPLHGGAVELAYQQFKEVGTPVNVPRFIREVKAKKMRLLGYGHRIYKTLDPRVRYVWSMLQDLEREGRSNDPLLRVALEIDRVASADQYFMSRNLKANADLYGCFVYTALGFEQDIISGMMLLSRMPGVMAHWREATSLPPKLWRPQ